MDLVPFARHVQRGPRGTATQGKCGRYIDSRPEGSKEVRASVGSILIRSVTQVQVSQRPLPSRPDDVGPSLGRPWTPLLAPNTNTEGAGS